MYNFKLAYKNIAGARRRTILTFLMLSFGVICYLIIESMLEGFNEASFKNYIDFQTGHYKIRNSAFDPDLPYDLENFIHDTAPIEKKLAGLPFVKGYAVRMQFIASIDNGTDSLPIAATGIDYDSDSRVFTLKNYISSGALEKGGLLLGKSLAKEMNAEIGDVLYLTFRNRPGMFSSMELILSGLIDSPDPGVNNSAAFINLEEAREYMDLPGASEISLNTGDYRDTEKYAETLKNAFPEMRVESWRELSMDFAALMETKRAGSSYVLIFIIIIALVGIINTILMSVYEKRQEIGTLMALGMEHRDVRNIFLFEGLIIGTLGSILGLTAGTLINLYFIYQGIDYSALMGDGDLGLNVMGVIKSAWVPGSYFKALIITLAASLLSSYYPAKKIMKMEPVDCLRIVQ